MVRLAVEEGGRPVGVEDPRQDRVFGRLQELRTHGFEEGALSEMKMETLLDIDVIWSLLRHCRVLAR